MFMKQLGNPHQLESTKFLMPGARQLWVRTSAMPSATPWATPLAMPLERPGSVWTLGPGLKTSDLLGDDVLYMGPNV